MNRNTSSTEGLRRRRALVIGNDAYQHCGVLKGAIKDANELHGKLQRLGFDEARLCTNMSRCVGLAK